MSQTVPPLDFSRIRGDNPAGRRHAFEDLVCYLAHQDRPDGAQEFRRIEGSGGDQGVEAIWLCNDGSVVGYQAKYELHAGSIAWSQAETSFLQAIVRYKTLKRYVFAFPCDFTSQQGHPQREGAWQKWQMYKNKWQQEAYKKGRSVEIDVWTEHELQRRIIDCSPGLWRYYFGTLKLDTGWFKTRFDTALQSIGDRYHPEDHVDVDVSASLDGLVRGASVRERIDRALLALSAIDITHLARWASTIQDQQLTCHIQNAEKQVRALDGLRATLDARPWTAWPAADWGAVAQALHKSTQDLLYRVYGQKPEKKSDSGGPDPRYLWNQATFTAQDLSSAAGQLARAVTHPAVRIDCSRVVLAIGPAGAGKSHLLADWMRSHLAAGGPGILLLGSHFSTDDPWSSIRRTLDLEAWSNEEVLGALDAAAEAAGTRAVICIDALNEGGGARLWRDRLRGFVADVRRYRNLALLLSCRSEFVPSVAPDPIADDEVRVDVPGFRSRREQERAAIVYMEKRGITRPSQPWLGEEFTNPLMLRACCEALRRDGKTAFPAGLQGISSIVRFYLDSIGRTLDGPSHRPSGLVEPTRVAIAKLTDLMAKDRCDFVSRSVAASAVDHAFRSYGSAVTQSTWLDVLIGSGLLREEPHPDHPVDATMEAHEPVIRIGFQLFGDYLIADRLLVPFASASSVKQAFAPGGTLAHLLDADGWRFGADGLIEALSVIVPEKYCVELIDCLPDSEDGGFPAHNAWFAFHDSLLRRAASGWNERTFDLLTGLRDFEILAILTRLAVREDHPCNADRTDRWLRGLKMPDRDAVWTVALARVGLPPPEPLPDDDPEDDPPHPVFELIDWAWKSPKAGLPDETLRLTATFLAWCLTTSNRSIRDRATRALAHLLLDRPSLFPGLLARFADVDDPYVPERVLAAAYGAACTRLPQSGAQVWAGAVIDHVFRRGVPAHPLTRDYGRGIVEAAIRLSGASVEDASLALVRPPYRVAWRIRIPTKQQVETAAKKAGGTRILWSATDMADFARYEIASHVHSFSRTPLTKRLPTPGPGHSRTPTQYDAEQAKLWVAKRAYDLGWTSARFGNDDLDDAHSGRSRPLIERIGKKYQWIALNEFLSFLCDRYHIERYGNGPPAPYDNPTQLGIIRDIDPTLFSPSRETDGPSLPSAALDKLRSALSPITDPCDKTWPFATSLLQTGAPPIAIMDDAGREWLMLHGEADISEDRLKGTHSFGPRREAWVRVTCIVVDAQNLGRARRALRDKRLTDHSFWGPVEVIDKGFLLEAPWRNTWPGDSWNDSDDEDFPIGVRWRHVIRHYRWEDSLDLSLNGSASTTLPSPWLQDAMGLQQIPRKPGSFCGSNSAVLFQAPGLDSAGNQPVLVSRNDFLSALEKNNMGCLWIVAGERNWYDTLALTPWACRYTSGVYSFAGGKLRGAQWHEDQGQSQ